MRRFLVRSIGLLLVVFGLLGGIGGLVALGWVTGELRDVRSSSLLGPGGNEDLRPLGLVAGVLGDAAATTASTGESLVAAQESLLAGAGASRELSIALRSLAAALDLEFVGGRPFADVTEPLTNSSTRLDELSVTIMSTRASLDRSRSDLDRLKRELGRLADQVEPMAHLDPTGALARGIGTVETLVQGIVGVFVVQSFLLFGIGLALLVIPLPASRS